MQEDITTGIDYISVFLGSAFGAGLISLIAIVLNNYFGSLHYKKDLKTFLWKEKIEAAKKASEYYLEFLNYINLLIVHLELLSDDDIGVSDLGKELIFYENKMKSKTTLDHHHINIFYDLISNESSELTIKIQKSIHKLTLISESDNLDLTKEIIEELKECYSELLNLYKKQIGNVRESIRKYIN